MTNRTDGRGGLRRRLAAGALALGVTAGCATVRYKENEPYVFTLAFDAGGCPASATSDLKNCPGGAEDCVQVHGGQTVRFVAAPGPGGKPLEFSLQFDPFGKTTIDSQGGVVQLPTRGVRKTTPKPYTFVVTRPGCEPLDPQIILN